MLHARITGWGKYLPRRVLTNVDLEKMIDTSDEWIVSRTGISERRIVSDDESTSTMAAVAGSEALKVAGLEPADLDMVILATNSPDGFMPASAAFVQNTLGAPNAAAFDVAAGCSGSLYALITAYQFINTEAYRNVLVIGSEAQSRIIDWSDRSTCVLFGDGAGAVLVQAGGSSSDMMSFVMGNDGSGTDRLFVPGPCGRQDVGRLNGHYYLQMEGREVFKFAVRTLASCTRQVLDKAGLDIADIDLLIPHQANTRINEAAIKALGIPREKVFSNLEYYGNMSAASPMVALCEAVEQGRIKKGDHVALVAFGAGLSWAAMLLRWQSGN
jgi:3-oxoacyl-[acyl-carrier-protein] synthase-3